MTVLELIDLIRQMAIRHPDVKGFYTGLQAQHDDSVLQYPSVRVVFPYSIAHSLGTNKSTLSLTVTVMVNEARQPLAPSVNINYNTENALLEEDLELHLENDMRDNAARIATHLIRFLQLSAEPPNSTFEIVRAEIRGVERGHADFLTGCNILFDFYLGSPYICEADEIFEQTA